MCLINYRGGNWPWFVLLLKREQLHCVLNRLVTLWEHGVEWVLNSYGVQGSFFPFPISDTSGFLWMSLRDTGEVWSSASLLLSHLFLFWVAYCRLYSAGSSRSFPLTVASSSGMRGCFLWCINILSQRSYLCNMRRCCCWTKEFARSSPQNFFTCPECLGEYTGYISKELLRFS